MLIYEHKRTEQIVNRLISAARFTQVAVILSNVLLFCTVGLGIGSTVGRSGFGIVGFGVGAVVGLVIGSYLAMIATVTIEWMAQSLIAQGEIMNALKEVWSQQSNLNRGIRASKPEPL